MLKNKKKHNVHDCQLCTYLKIRINVVATGLSLEVCTKIWHNLQPETLDKLLVKLYCITTIKFKKYFLFLLLTYIYKMEKNLLEIQSHDDILPDFSTPRFKFF